MSMRININNQMLIWAVTRAGFDMLTFAEEFPLIQKWLNGEKQPTVKQLETFSKKVYLPFGYLFLTEPPNEKLPIPYFRTNNNQTKKVSINVYDTVLLMQQRQDWLSDYLNDNNFEPLQFVGRFHDRKNISEIVQDIRNTLQLQLNWANNFRTWTDALNYLVEVIEDNGIIVSFNSVVENNNKRKISVDECRGFVLVDEFAPFMFINNGDFKSAQMFTLVHELAHIWTGHSAGFDFEMLQPANDPIEKLCDQVAAEFLVPEELFNAIWGNNPNTSIVARHFKVSEIVIARRALDTGVWNKTQFLRFYEEYSQREFIKRSKKSAFGDFFTTAKKRLSITFAAHINQAVKTGQLLYRDACKLTSMKGDTYEKFFSNQL